MKNRYRTSEIAKIFNISKQTLIFYHKKDILVPDYIDDENGYRYYSNSQIWDLFFIITLKESGFSLEEIKKYSRVKKFVENIKFLEEKVDDIDKRINELKKSKKIIKEKILCLKEMSSNLEEQIRVVKRDREKAFFIKLKNPFDESEIAETYDKLKRICNKNNIKNINFVSTVQKKSLYKLKDLVLEKIGIVLPKEIDMEGQEYIQEGEYVVLKHKTTFDMIDLTYQNLIKYISEKGYEITGDSIEIGSEVVVPMENGFGGIIEIFIPIKKIEKI
ncbi:MAG: MerR family transcriptional regulator [Cetobacterium sp.]|uniref:MerR family transcriptional regulator n=1 Tax=Cetobacterium sp. TaxID=2071632 RepID=UPI002FC7AAF7